MFVEGGTKEILQIINQGRLSKEELYRHLNSEQIDIIKNMIESGSVKEVNNNESNQKYFALTDKGKVSLLYETHRDKINEFGDILQKEGHDTTYLQEYLMYCSMNDDIEMFSVSAYIMFCNKIKNEKDKTRARVYSESRNI